MELAGTNTGENLYVQNPYTDSLGHFCIDSIIINGSFYKTDLNSSALQLDFKRLNIPLGETVTIVIYHDESCRPRILSAMTSPPRISK